MPTSFTGGCFCGAVRYQVRGEPVRMLNCHCRDCQRASGTAFAAIVTVRQSEVEMTGELRFYGTVGGSGHKIERGFCPTCGSQVAIRPGRVPDYIGLQAGTLDEPSLHRPSIEIYTASAPPWDVLAEGTQKYPGDWRR